MTQYIIKVAVTVAVVVAVSEVSNRNSLLGGLLASLPLVSVLAMVWLYLETRDAAKVAALSTSIFWLVLPSLVLFVALPYLLKLRINFYLALGLAIGLMLLSYGLMIVALKKLGTKL